MTDRAHDKPQPHEPETALAVNYRADEILGGRYRIISLIGRGGMGVVYRVEQIFLGKELALKTIDTAAQSDTSIRRFQAEARAVFAVNHPNIVAVHDFGLLDDQTPFLAMEYIKGSTLSDLIHSRSLSVEDALKIFVQVCNGLAHAHKHGVVHRDVKPGNIMVLSEVPLDTEGSVKILDFGIAKLTQDEAGEVQALTRTGEIFGSPIYMSPEQCSGGQIDYRSDVYSLGCVIFEALTGTPPYVAESALSTMMMHQTAAIPTLKEASLGISFDPALERVVATMIAKNPNQRYQDLSVAANDLAAIRKGQTANLSVGQKPTVLASKRQAPSTITIKRHQMALWIAGVAALSIVATYLTMQMWFASQEKSLLSSPPSHSDSSESTSKLSSEELKEDIVQKANSSSPKEHVAFNIDIKNNRNLFDEKFVSDEDMEAFKNYKDAQRLDLHELSSHEVTNKGLSYLKDSRVLTLYMQGDLRDIDDFTQLPQLDYLKLSRGWINANALANIVKLKMLHTLSLDRVKNLTNAQIQSLAASNSLEKLILTEKEYSPAFIKDLRERMPQCELEHYREPEEKPAASDAEQYNRISSRLKKIRSRNPNSAGVATCLKQLADIRSIQKRFGEAKALLDQAIQLLEENGNENALPPVLESAATVADKLHDLKSATKYSNRLVELAPKTLLHNERFMYDIIAKALYYPVSIQQWQTAENYCNVAIENLEKFPDAVKPFARMQFYANAGDYNIKLGKNPEALKDYTKLMELTDPDPKTNLYWHASSLVRMGRCQTSPELQKNSMAKGMAMIEEAGMPDTFNLLEHYCDACVLTGMLLKQEHKFEEALEYNKKGLDVVEKRLTSPVHLDAHARRQAFAFDIAKLLQRLGRMDEMKAMEKKYNISVDSRTSVAPHTSVDSSKSH